MPQRLNLLSGHLADRTVGLDGHRHVRGEAELVDLAGA
jgi:hypothetical protein